MLRAILLAVALLTAQQNALAHAVWHAGGASSQSQDQDHERLCDLHSAFGSVLALLSGKALAPLANPAQMPDSGERIRPAPRLRACSPLSRGPPAPL